jgi:hypothetical protein
MEYLVGGKVLNIEVLTKYQTDKEATSSIIDVVQSRVKDGNISAVVIASMKGKTLLKYGEALKGVVEVVGITEFEYSASIKKSMKKLKVVSIENADLPLQDNLELRETLLTYGSGVKAALEVAVIAAEKGLASGSILAVGGGERGGLDTAIVVNPISPTNAREKLEILEVLALPS